MEAILRVLAANFPQLVVLLFILLCAFLVLREWRLVRTELAREIHLRVQAEIGSLTGDILKKSEQARNQLSVLADIQSDVHREREKFDEQMSAAKAEMERALVEVQARS